MTRSEAAANYAHHFLGHFHRAAYECGDRVILFGEDAYSTDARSRREVELIREILPSYGLAEEEFGLSDDEITWAIVARPDPITFLTLMIFRPNCGGLGRMLVMSMKEKTKGARLFNCNNSEGTDSSVGELTRAIRILRDADVDVADFVSAYTTE